MRSRTVLAMLLLAALSVPAVGAAPPADATAPPAAPAGVGGDAAGPLDTAPASNDHELVRCGNGGVGALLDDGSGYRGVCVEVTYGFPPGWFPQPVFPETTPCPTGQHGMNATWLNTTAAVCYTYDSRVPETLECRSLTTCVRVSVTDCEPAYNVDPAVYVSDGGVIACAFVYHDTPARPDVDGDLTPCEGGFDPTIYVNDAYVRVCVWVLA